MISLLNIKKNRTSQNSRLPSCAKNQKGFIFGLDMTVVLSVVGALSVALIPVYMNYTESSDSQVIVTGFTTIQRAVQEAYPDGDYTEASMSKISSTLPEDFKTTAINGQDWSVKVSSSNKSVMEITLSVPSNRVRDRVVAKLGSSKVSESGNNVMLTTR